MSRKKPTAVDRTMSLFTGKTDLESDKARDGTVGVYRPKRRRKKGEPKGGGWKYVPGPEKS